MKKHIATYQIHDTFLITGIGIVFIGEILEGTIFLTDASIRFDCNGKTLERKIKWIDDQVRVEKRKPSVGILIETKNDSEVLELKKWNPHLTIGKIYSATET